MTDAPKIGIVMQIAEAERELALRKNVYRNQISAGKLKPEQADMNIARMEAIIRTLRFCQKNEAEFHAFVNGRKSGPSPAAGAAHHRGEETSLGPRIRGDDDSAALKAVLAKIAGTEFSIASQVEELGLAQMLYRSKAASVQGYRVIRMIAVQATLQRLKEALESK